MAWLFLIALFVGLYWIARSIWRATFRAGRIIAAPRNAAEKEARSGLWWALGLPISIAAGILVITFVGMAVWYAFHPDTTSREKPPVEIRTTEPQKAGAEGKPAEQNTDPISDGMPSDYQSAPFTLKAIQESPDVQSSPLSTGGMSVRNPFGLCGILYEGKSDYLWSAARPTSYPSFDIGMAAAIRQCEAAYRARVIVPPSAVPTS